MNSTIELTDVFIDWYHCQRLSGAQLMLLRCNLVQTDGGHSCFGLHNDLEKNIIRREHAFSILLRSTTSHVAHTLEQNKYLKNMPQWGSPPAITRPKGN